MAIRTKKPTSAGSRFVSYKTYEELTKDAVTPKSLLTTVKKTGGRNAQGKITVRNIGGENRRKYRVIDFKRKKDGVVARVESIQYDPNRTAYIALLTYADGEKRFIIAPRGLSVGDKVMSGTGAEIKPGNCLELKDIPLGAKIHNIELQPGRGGQMVRSAGESAQLMAKEGAYVTLRLPSGEMRKVLAVCRATIGEIGNEENEIVSLGKAGRKRHMGVRPSVRGSAMNPVDHPHGGGEGKSPVGHAGPMTPWGKPALGYKTRKHNKASDKLMVKRCNAK